MYTYNHWVYATKRPSTAKAFTYKIWFPLLDLRYIGYKTINKNNSWLSYKSSSKEVKKLINAGHKAIYRIVNWFDNAEDARKEEIAAMTYYDVTHRSEYLNQCIGGVKFSRSGKTHTAETKAKMSAAKQNISDLTRAKMSATRKGKTKSAETLAKLSAASKGRTAHNKGKTVSDETRAKISASKQNISAETRSKISASMQIGLYVTPLGTFETAKEASIAHNCSNATIGKRCKSTSPQFDNWAFFKY